ncbi:MAG: NADH-quinone oxidoreductase subunit H [Deltaproteobacteria bacterium]|nr:NADH-quinone oxidoreductase subunit H [Deltaproteobacteria bacterium]
METSTVVVSVFLFSIIALVFMPIMTWVERKQSALMQDRIGANRAEIFGIRAIGLIHPVTDAIKMFTKEDVIPTGANRFLHAICPFIAVVPAIVSFAVIPYGGSYTAWGSSWSLVVADLDYGVLYIFAIGSIAAYGSILAGWAGNNNWGMLGSIRVAAQMLSYEVSMGISVVGLFMIYGTLRLTDIGVAQQETFRLLGFVEHFGWATAGTAWVDFIKIPLWGAILQPLPMFIFLAAILAENKRPPFDTPEGESEIVAGYFIEYSGMKFGLFTAGELVEVVVISALMAALFLGGWSIPYLPETAIIGGLSELFGPNLANVLAMIIAVHVFFAKVLALIFFQMLIRWSLPRFRYDQVMNLGWKILLPLSIANIVVTGFVILLVAEITG